MTRDKIQYISGQKLGNCTYLYEVESNSTRSARFRCECGKEFNAGVSKVKTLYTKTCGCLKAGLLSKRNFRHGLKNKKEYNLWMHMKQRCYNPKYPKFENWGGRGISVCERWLNSFANFYEDMGEKPSHCRGLDRIDNNKGYYKENCRWATYKVQNNNTRKNVFFEYNNQKHTLVYWSEIVGIGRTTLLHRIRKLKWTIEKAFETPVNFRNAAAY